MINILWRIIIIILIKIIKATFASSCFQHRVYLSYEKAPFTWDIEECTLHTDLASQKFYHIPPDLDFSEEFIQAVASKLPAEGQAPLSLLHLFCFHSSLALALGSAEKIFSLFWSSEFLVKEKHVIKKSSQDHFPSLRPQFRARSDSMATPVQADVCFLLTLFLSTLSKSQFFFPIRPGFAQ